MILIMSLFILIPSVYADAIPVPDVSKKFSLVGAGATFPFPLIDLWRVEYNKEFQNVNLNYQSIGSGGGIKQHIEKTVNFAATDVPLKESESALAPNTLHIPETIGGVVLSYNIPDIPTSGLRLTGEIISGIYLGQIQRWNDPQIIDINPDLSLPDRQIIPVRRSDGSGTTFVLTDYLSKQSSEFQEQIGVGKSVSWQEGVAAAGNEGVAGIILSTPSSIGYVELAYAYQTDMTFAYIENADGTNFVKPSIESVADASVGTVSALPAAHESWDEISIVNSAGSNAYPIASFSYLLLYEDLAQVTDSVLEARALVHMINWMINDGQRYSETLQYVPIPSEITKLGKAGLDRITYNGEFLFSDAASNMTETSPSNGGCLVATATFGTEMSLQVQFLREIRDDTLMSSIPGSSFMTNFNKIYYSVSPVIADVQRTNPVINDMFGVLLYPGLNLLHLMQYADSDHTILGLGMLVIILNILFYVGIPISSGVITHRLVSSRRLVVNSK